MPRKSLSDEHNDGRTLNRSMYEMLLITPQCAGTIGGKVIEHRMIALERTEGIPGSTIGQQVFVNRANMKGRSYEGEGQRRLSAV